MQALKKLSSIPTHSARLKRTVSWGRFHSLTVRCLAPLQAQLHLQQALKIQCNKLGPLHISTLCSQLVKSQARPPPLAPHNPRPAAHIHHSLGARVGPLTTQHGAAERTKRRVRERLR